MFLVNGIDIAVVIVVVILVLGVIFLRFILPKIKSRNKELNKHEIPSNYK